MYPLLYIFSDKAIFILRIVLGLILVVHGWPKVRDRAGTDAWFESTGFRPGWFWGPVAAAVEFVGGLMLLSGFFAGYAAFLVAGQFAVITLWKLKNGKGLAFGYELDLLMFAAALALMTLGPGAWSLDGLRGTL